MLDKRFTIDGCAADLEMARKALDHLTRDQKAADEQIHKAAVHAKKIEVKLASAKLAQAEYYLSSLMARMDYLEARCAREEGATRAEQEELAWAHQALPINSATVSRLADDLAQRKNELASLLKQQQVILYARHL